jgi:RNA polymerase sigma factor for flagellar operon FliA
LESGRWDSLNESLRIWTSDFPLESGKLLCDGVMMSKNAALLRKYKEDPKKLSQDQKDGLIKEYSPLIRFVAQKIAVRLPSNIELDDLISAGVIGLMDAIDKYDPSRDNKFKTYAEFRVRGAILDELRAQDWVPRSIRDKAKLLDKTLITLEADLGRAATDEEISKALNVSVDEFHSLVNQVRPISLLSIDDAQTFSNTDKKSILNLLEGSKLNNPYNQLNIKTIKEYVARGIEELPERQRLVLSLYYYEDLNLKEIGQVLRVTESRVSQLHAQAVQRLRARLQATIASGEAELV